MLDQCIACTIIQNVGAPSLYVFVSVDPSQAAAQLDEGARSAPVRRMQPWAYSFTIVCFFSICCVKLSYLAFFANLVGRQRRLMMYWRVVTAFVIIASPLMMFSILIGCPEFGDKAYKCSTNNFTKRMFAVMIYTNVLDVFTDLLVASVPVILLYPVSISTRQKINLASFLCLSLVMVVIAIIRVATTKWAVYIVWATFWAQVEACVAIIMLSTTAFRQLFVAHSRAMTHENGPQMSDKLRYHSSDDGKAMQSVEMRKTLHISPPVLQIGPTGVQTIISGNPTWLRDLDTARDVDLEEPCPTKRQKILIRHDIYAQSEPTNSMRLSVA